MLAQTQVFESTGRAITVTMALAYWLNFLGKVFKKLYLRNLPVEVVHTCPDVESGLKFCAVQSILTSKELN